MLDENGMCCEEACFKGLRYAELLLSGVHKLRDVTMCDILKMGEEYEREHLPYGIG